MTAARTALGTPVACFVFNRPAETRLVFDAIRAARPRTLLLVADGPRPGHATDAERCAAVREIIAGVDWPCEVLSEVADVNLGCRRRVASGLTWVFEQVEEAIILEDDCLPDPTFFPYCAELLERYRDDARVALIGGYSLMRSQPTDDASYYFSRYPHMWGWASWRRVWKQYDVEMREWPTLRAAGLLDGVFPNPRASAYWRAQFDRTYAGQIDTWDYQLFLTVWQQHLLCVMPCRNLITNLGFHADATHTRAARHFGELAREPMPFPLRHPAHFMRNQVRDAYDERHRFSGAGDEAGVWSTIAAALPENLLQMARHPLAHLQSWREYREARRAATRPARNSER